MLTATCHCGALSVRVPRRPRSITNCNCSICRRYGVLWAYYKDRDVQLQSTADATADYRWGPDTQRFIRCKTCGCVMQWRKHVIGRDTWTGVNARNFDPDELGDVRIRLLDGAHTWKLVG